MQKMSKPAKTKNVTIKRKIMQAVCEIPMGKTISYSQLARRVGLKGRERYVASFLKENPYLLAVPCHRIIRKNGDCGGYVLGRDFKKYLLDRERALK